VQGFASLWNAGSTAQGANAIGMFLLLGGIWATAFHLANGTWSGALLWRILPTPQSKRFWKVICFIFGIALAGAGSVAWYAFTLAPNAASALAAK
jgi:succinate dehydrogenase / fumarate reductase cytochrome b subunit